MVLGELTAEYDKRLTFDEVIKPPRPLVEGQQEADTTWNTVGQRCNKG
ncbi:MAG: hypothetical protein QW196_06025 [Sulfolobales archaeon]